MAASTTHGSRLVASTRRGMNHVGVSRRGAVVGSPAGRKVCVRGTYSSPPALTEPARHRYWGPQPPRVRPYAAFGDGSVRVGAESPPRRIRVLAGSDATAVRRDSHRVREGFATMPLGLSPGASSAAH